MNGMIPKITSNFLRGLLNYPNGYGPIFFSSGKSHVFYSVFYLSDTEIRTIHVYCKILLKKLCDTICKDHFGARYEDILPSFCQIFDNYIRQRSWANVMYSSPFVCLSVCLFVCLFVCLSVSRITQKVIDGFERNIMGR